MPATTPSSREPVVVVVGSSMVDLVAYCDEFPGDGETLVGRSFLQGFGGKGANQAVMLARLGSDVRFVGRVGDDGLGGDIVVNLRTAGVDVSEMAVSPGCASGVAPIWVDGRGVNRIIVVPGANATLTATDVDVALGRIGTAAVVVAQLETPQPATDAAFAWARDVGATTILNPAPAAPIEASLLGVTDWLVPNETEFAALAGVAPDPGTVTTAAGRWRCRVAVTMGERGVLLTDGNGGVVVVGATAVDAVDTTGAGDAFVGGFAHALANGHHPVAAARLGCACGSLAVTRAGAQASFPSRDEVYALLTPSGRQWG